MPDAQPLGAQSATTYRQSRQGLALQTRAHAHEAEEALQVCGPHARREQRALLTEADAPVSARQGGASPQHTRRQRTRSRTMSRAVSSLSRLRTAPTASMRGELHRQEHDARRSTTHTHTHTHLFTSMSIDHRPAMKRGLWDKQPEPPSATMDRKRAALGGLHSNSDTTCSSRYRCSFAWRSRKAAPSTQVVANGVSTQRACPGCAATSNAPEDTR